MVPFRIFRGPIVLKPVTGKELFFAVSYSKPALIKCTRMSPEFLNEKMKNCKIEDLGTWTKVLN